MAIRDISNLPPEQKERARKAFHSNNQRKADQHWEMGGLARQDGDLKDMERHYAEARRYQQLAAEEG